VTSETYENTKTGERKTFATQTEAASFLRNRDVTEWLLVPRLQLDVDRLVEENHRLHVEVSRATRSEEAARGRVVSLDQERQRLQEKGQKMYDLISYADLEADVLLAFILGEDRPGQ